MKTITEKDFEPFLFLKGYRRYPSVGKGWYPLLWELCHLILRHLARCQNQKLIDSFEVTTVKEKLGGLRFYVTGADDYIYSLIDYFEAQSYTVCESCGDAGETRPLYWIKTLCKKCYWVEIWRCCRINGFCGTVSLLIKWLFSN